MAESDSIPYGRIYLVTNTVTKRVYVGQTIGTLKARWKGHCNAPKSSRLRLSIDMHGREAFTIEQIAEAQTKQELDDLERFHIAQHKATDKTFGYNFAQGGAGKPISRDATERIAAKLRGRKLPQEQKDKISARKRGVKPTPDHVAKMIEGKLKNSGFKHSEEAKAIMSAAAVGKKMPPCTDAHRLKLAEAARLQWATGRGHSLNRKI
jgi:group I intron endonuclease